MKNVVPAHRRHDISDETWALLEPHLPGREGACGVSPRTIDCLSMRFSGFCERARYGGICRPITVDRANMHRRFIRWRDKGVWEKLLSLLINEPDDEWPMIDASHCKVHPHAAGVKGGLAGSLGGVLVTPRLDQDIQHVAVLIHGPPQTPPAMLKLSVPNEHANALRLNVVSRLSRVFNPANPANLSDRPRIGRESV